MLYPDCNASCFWTTAKDAVERMSYAQALVADAAGAYGGDFSPSKDLKSAENTVWHYSRPENQLKYAHMYFAKYVGCWHALAQYLSSDADGPIVSIGAGPLFDVMGWLCNRSDRGHSVVVHAYDALDWMHIRHLRSFAALYQHIHAGRLAYHAGTYFPGPPAPPQLSTLSNLEVIPPTAIPAGALLFLPYVLNHLVGLVSPLGAVREPELAAWLEAARARARAVLIVDMYSPGTTDAFLGRVADLLKMPPFPGPFTFQPCCGCLGKAYRDRQAERRTGERYPTMAQASVVVGRPGSDGWTWFDRSEAVARL